MLNILAWRSTSANENSRADIYDHFVLEESPSHKDCFMRTRRWARQSELIQLPMPWLYYCGVVTNYSVEKWVKVTYIGWSFTPISSVDTHLYSIPLPNTGFGGYTCAPSWKVNPELKSPQEMALDSACGFWEQHFSYWEGKCSAHIELYKWAGIDPYGIVATGNDVTDLTPFRRWSKLEVDQMEKLSWATCAPFKLREIVSTPTLELVSKKLITREDDNSISYS